jgi:3D (Asp-Asp-Asp) domain-containing protein
MKRWGRNYVEVALTVVCLPMLASPARAQCKALFFTMPVPASYSDAGATCVSPVFVDLGNGAVTDRANHLLWAKAAHQVTPYSQFSDLQAYCNGLNLAGRGGWRLPDVAQLQTLLPPSACWSVLDDCGTGDPDIPSTNGIVWANSGVSPFSYYCPSGFGCNTHMWAVATGLGTKFGVLTGVPGLPARKRVDARDINDGSLVRCVADGLKLAITPEPVKIPANAPILGGKVLTQSRLALDVTDYIGPASGVQLTLSSDRTTQDVFDGPASPTAANGHAEAFVSTRNQTSVSTIDSTTPLVWTDPKGVITWLPAKYETKFNTTCYMAALESDSTDNFVDSRQFSWCLVNPTGRSFRRKFMQDVVRQGSGIPVSQQAGEFVKYDGNGRCYYFDTCPRTSSGACAQVGVTAAVDRTVVPFGGAIDMETLGPRRAQDGGDWINDYDIDIYNGIGEAACYGWPDKWKLEVTFVSY